MKYEVNMSVRGRFTVEVETSIANKEEIKKAADQMFAEANFGELADIDAEFVSCELIDEEEPKTLVPEKI